MKSGNAQNHGHLHAVDRAPHRRGVRVISGQESNRSREKMKEADGIEHLSLICVMLRVSKTPCGLAAVHNLFVLLSEALWHPGVPEIDQRVILNDRSLVTPFSCLSHQTVPIRLL